MHIPPHRLQAIRVNDDAHGKRCYKVPVVVHFNNSTTFETQELRLDVVAHSAVEAANWVRDQFATRPETEIFAYGPKGGKTYRYIGWYSCIASSLMGIGLPNLQQEIDLTGGAA
jgi:hypothetical protein